MYFTTLSEVCIDSGTLVTWPWYNLDLNLSGLQTGHVASYPGQILMHSIIITTWMGADSALKDVI